MHANSVAAFRQEETRLGKRELLILAWLDLNPGRYTDRQIMRGLKFTEPNCVRPRITHLVQMGNLVEVGAVKCPETRKTVRVVSRPAQLDLIAA